MDGRTPADGARVVARALTVDDGFKARLLTDSRSALAEMGIAIPEETPHLTVVENTEGPASLGGMHPLLMLPPDAAWAARPTGTRAWPTGPAPSGIRGA